LPSSTVSPESTEKGSAPAPPPPKRGLRRLGQPPDYRDIPNNIAPVSGPLDQLHPGYVPFHGPGAPRIRRRPCSVTKSRRALLLEQRASRKILTADCATGTARGLSGAYRACGDRRLLVPTDGCHAFRFRDRPAGPAARRGGAGASHRRVDSAAS